MTTTNTTPTKMAPMTISLMSRPPSASLWCTARVMSGRMLSYSWCLASGPSVVLSRDGSLCEPGLRGYLLCSSFETGVTLSRDTWPSGPVVIRSRDPPPSGTGVTLSGKRSPSGTGDIRSSDLSASGTGVTFSFEGLSSGTGVETWGTCVSLLRGLFSSGWNKDL